MAIHTNGNWLTPVGTQIKVNYIWKVLLFIILTIVTMIQIINHYLNYITDTFLLLETLNLILLDLLMLLNVQLWKQEMQMQVSYVKYLFLIVKLNNFMKIGIQNMLNYSGLQ